MKNQLICFKNLQVLKECHLKVIQIDVSLSFFFLNGKLNMCRHEDKMIMILILLTPVLPLHATSYQWGHIQTSRELCRYFVPQHTPCMCTLQDQLSHCRQTALAQVLPARSVLEQPGHKWSIEMLWLAVRASRCRIKALLVPALHTLL